MSYANGFGRKQVQVEYTVTEVLADEWRVSKLAEGEKLLDSYMVRTTASGRVTCECLAWITGKTRPCKHIKLMLRWVHEKQPIRTYPNSEVK